MLMKVREVAQGVRVTINSSPYDGFRIAVQEYSPNNPLYWENQGEWRFAKEQWCRTLEDAEQVFEDFVQTEIRYASLKIQ